MTIKEFNKIKKPKMVLDNSLEKYRGKVLFPEKLAAANKALKDPELLKLIKKGKKI